MRFLRTATVACVLATVPLLGGCFDIDSNIALKPDGSGKITMRLTFDEGVEDMLAAAIELEKLEGQSKLGSLSDGVCKALASPPAMPRLDGTTAPRQQISPTLAVRETRANGKITCEFVDDVPDVAQALQVPLAMSVWSIRRSGPDRTEVSFNPDAIPDLSLFVDAMMGGALQERLGRPGAGGAGGQRGEDLAPILRRGIAGAVSTLFSDRQIKLSITGQSVVETTGTTVDGGRTAVFSMPIGPVVTALLGKKQRGVVPFKAVVRP